MVLPGKRIVVTVRTATAIFLLVGLADLHRFVIFCEACLELLALREGRMAVPGAVLTRTICQRGQCCITLHCMKSIRAAASSCSLSLVTLEI